jgi:hypothetical protein
LPRGPEMIAFQDPAGERSRPYLSP